MNTLLDDLTSCCLRTVYVESMGRTLHNLFKCYYSQLLKLDFVMATKNDLIVVEEAALKSMFTNKVNNADLFDNRILTSLLDEY